MALHQRANKALEEFIAELYPDLRDGENEKEKELADFLKGVSKNPLELRITQDPKGNMDVELKA